MKLFESKLICMKDSEITCDFVSGMPNNEYPNSEQYSYHDFFELEYFTEGAGIHYVNGVPYKVEPGYMYLLFPGDSHHKRLDEKVRFEIYNLKVSKDAVYEDIFEELKKFPRPLCINVNTDKESSSYIINLFDRLDGCLHKGQWNFLTAKLISLQILTAFLNFLQNTEHSTEAAADQPIRQAIDFIEKNYHRDITLKDIAERLDLSENYAGIYFKKHTMLNFKEYLNRTRLSHAMTLCRETNLSVKEIAYRTGFCSPEYLTRQFTAFFGLPPTALRKPK